MLSDIAYCVYTHSDCKDVWPIFFGQTNKYLDEKLDKFIFIDSGYKGNDIPSEYCRIEYDDRDSYTDRVHSCIARLKSKYVLHQHEDMFLYGKPDWDSIESYLFFLENGDYDAVRLIKSGEMGGRKILEDLVEVPIGSNCNFVLQPTIVNRLRMLELFEGVQGENIWDFEVKVQNVCRKKSFRSLYADTSSVRIGNHYESVVYPYVATAIVKGKWNTREYERVLFETLKEYNIDIGDRGEVD